MADTKIRYGQSTNGVGVASNGTSLVDVYTFGSGITMPDGATGAGGIIDLVRIDNQDTVAQIVELHLVPSGDAAGADTRFFRDTLQAGEVFRYRGPERTTAGAKIQMRLGAAHTTNPVYAKADVSEIYV